MGAIIFGPGSGAFGDGDPSFVADSCLAKDSPGAGFSVDTGVFRTWQIRNSNSYNNATNYSPSSGGNSSFDPRLGTCMVWIPDSSALKRAGANGADIGANVLYRYENGALTSKPLWDTGTGRFPCGAIVAGVNDVPGSSCFDVHERLNVNVNGCAFPAGYKTVAAPLPNLIDKSHVSISSVDSQETSAENGSAANAIDGNSGTLWHTQWQSASPQPPHTLVLKLDQSYSLTALSYLPRQDGQTNGTVKDYKIYVSLDGVNWGSPVAAGTFANSLAEKQVVLSANTGSFVKFVALSEVNGNPWTSAAEIKLYGTPGSSRTAPPTVSLTAPANNATVSGMMTVTANATDDVGIAGVQFKFDDVNMGAEVAAPPYSITVDTRTAADGSHKLTAVARDTAGVTATSSAVTITVNNSGTAPSPIASSHLSIVSVDSQETAAQNGAAANAIDGNAGTFWHTQWSSANPAPPHTLVLKLDQTHSVSGLSYLPRQDGSSNGMVKTYSIYTSLDGVNWTTAVASGSFDSSTAEKKVTFSARAANYVKFVALSEINGNPWTSAAEIKLVGFAY